jgi:hypothetical protein
MNLGFGSGYQQDRLLLGRGVAFVARRFFTATASDLHQRSDSQNEDRKKDFSIRSLLRH